MPSVAELKIGGLPEAEQLLRPGASTSRPGVARRFLRERTGVTGAVIVLLLLGLAVFGPALAPHNPIAINTNRLLLSPRRSAWFGTDGLGRDIFSRVIAGARVSVQVALIVGFSVVTIGIVVGLVAGYFGSWVDTVAMRLVDVVLAFPSLILALAIAGTLGGSEHSLIIALVVTGWPYYARLLRGGVLAERERQYVEAERGIGARPRRIVLRHILPNAISPIVVLLSFDLGTIILYIASLGYLGVGIPPPTPEWGTMVADGRNHIFTGPQTVIFPGLAIALAVVGFNLLGDGLRNAFDPLHERIPGRQGWFRGALKAVITRARRRHGATDEQPASVGGLGAGPSGPAGPGGPVAPGLVRPGPVAAGGEASRPVLEVEHLRVVIRQGPETLEPVSDVSLSLTAGETLGLVGESGCGKTMTALAMLGLLPPGATIAGGQVSVAGRRIDDLAPAALRAIRGREIAMVFQDPTTSLNPTMTIGRQIAGPVRFHLGVTRNEARARAIEALSQVGMPRPAERLADYPHQLSGGQRQRVMLAMAPACQPSFLIADEPTTSLDVSIQDQILALLHDLKERTGMGLLLITHDMGVIARLADRVLVMYAGRVVEAAPTSELFARPRHRYTEALLESVPRPDHSRSEPLYSIPGRPPELTARSTSCPFAPRCRFVTEVCRDQDPPLVGEAGHQVACFHPGGEMPRVTPRPVLVGAGSSNGHAEAVPAEALLVVDAVVKEFRQRYGGVASATVKAVSGVSFSVAAGETFALVGESGCGKTTLGRMITALERPDAGSVRVGGHDLAALGASELRRARRQFQLVFQDPFGSMDPRVRVGPALVEPMVVHATGSAATRRARVGQLLDEVGLEPRSVERYPHELSGGQRQRVGFARALSIDPRLVVADEPVSALDVSIRSQILNLMRRLQVDHQLTYVLISHDLSVVRYLADRVGVMYLGKLVELGPAEAVYGQPRHPYTAGLLAASPVPDPALERRRRLAAVRGEPPSPVDPPSGCRFRTRCPIAQSICAELEPPLQAGLTGDHQVACHFPLATAPAPATVQGATVS